MDKHSDPLQTIIDFAWASGADRFWVNNAKDELKKLKEKVQKLETVDKPSAWAKINSYGDLYDLRLQYNPHDDQTKVIPLYRLNYE